MKWIRAILGLCLLTSTSALALAAFTAFRDVPEGAWYSEAVNHLAELNILQGNNGRYRPTAAVNRAELAVALDRLLEYIETGSVEVGGVTNTAIELAVPFTSQAPSGEWVMPYKEACEEASLIMVKYFWTGEKLTPEEANREILELVAWEESNGYGIDVSAEELAEIAREFYGLEASVFYDNAVSIPGIKAILDAGSPVIIPAAGQILANPGYTAGGPPYHMIVLIGHDENGFITHDPGVSAGASYHYSFATIENAIHDWTGSKSTVAEDGRKAMVVVRKSE